MCDTVVRLERDRALFAKNSDRPIGEIQLIEGHGARQGGGELRTTYLTIADTGAHAVLGARPDWIWGFEHGVNEHRVAIGNEEVWTIDDPDAQPAALIGMDLVRLGLERGTSATHALDVMVDLLERHGQGGIANAADSEAYFSSFLVADPSSAWILETSGRTWVAKPVEGTAAISNRLTLGRDWTRSSADVAPGRDFDDWRDPRMWTGHADVRLDANRRNVCERAAPVEARQLADALRDHGHGHGHGHGGTSPGALPGPAFDPGTGEGVSVCLHLRDYQATTSSIIAELPVDPDTTTRVWVAPASPCSTVFFACEALTPPAALGDPDTIARFGDLARRLERDPTRLGPLREALAHLEELGWSGAEADAEEVVAAADRTLG